jgi:hypothetical protein
VRIDSEIGFKKVGENAETLLNKCPGAVRQARICPGGDIFREKRVLEPDSGPESRKSVAPWTYGGTFIRVD